MTEKNNTRLILLLVVCAICIVSAFAIEGGDKTEQIVEPQVKSSRESKSTRANTADNQAVPLLALDKLGRSAKPDSRGKASDLFPPSAWVRTPPPVAVVAPPPPPPPSAPPLPFSYMGKFTEPSGKTVVYLGQGDKALTVSAGDLIDGSYRIEAVDNAQLTFIYLPLNIKQTLPIGNSP